MSSTFKAVFIIGVLIVSPLREGQAKTVNVAIPSYSMSLIGFAVAKEQGYYRQEDLDVNFILMTAPLASGSLIGGNLEFATVPLLPVSWPALHYGCSSARSTEQCFGFMGSRRSGT